MSSTAMTEMPVSKNAKQVPILAAVVGLLVVGLLFIAVWRPANAEKSDLSTSVADASAKVEAAQRRLSDYRKDTASFQSLLTAAQAADAYLPYYKANTVHEAEPDLRLDLPVVVEQAAFDADLDIVQGSYSLVASDDFPEGMAAMQSDMSAQGTMRELEAFIDAVAQHRHTVTLTSISLALPSNADDDGSGVVLEELPLSGELKFNFTAMFWFTTREPVDFDNADGPAVDEPTTPEPDGPLGPLTPVSAPGQSTTTTADTPETVPEPEPEDAVDPTIDPTAGIDDTGFTTPGADAVNETVDQVTDVLGATGAELDPSAG